MKDCPNNRGGGTSERKKLVCFLCNEEGHFKQDCPSRSQNAQPGGDKRLCFNCNQPGHLKQDCPKKNPRSGQDWGDRVCYHCNQPGHFAKDCPNKEDGPGERQVCFHCSQPGHFAKDCPKKEDSPEDRQVCFLCNKPGHLKQDCPNKSDGQGYKVQCYHCNQLGHIKRDCPELCDTGFSSSREGKTMNNDREVSKGEEHWPVLSKDADVKVKSKQGFTSAAEPSDSKRATSSMTGKDTKVRNTSGTKKSGESFGKDAMELEGERIDRKQGRDGRDFRERRAPFPPFIDTHCHLEYVFERYSHKGTFSEFMKEWKYPNNFDGCIASFCDSAAFSSFGVWSDLLDEPESKVWAAFGIHPHNAKYYYSTTGLEEKLLKCLEHGRCVALGEIGLDYGEKSPSDHTTQKEVFTRQLQLGVTLKKPFVLHCRDAEEDMLNILKQHVPAEWKIHFHCFTGKLETALEFLSSFPNSYLGVCGNVTFDNAYNVTAVAQDVPLNRMLVETDAPYHTPRNLPKAGRCRHSHPAHAHYVAKEIARLKGLDLAEVLQTIRENTRAMYGI